MIPVDRSGDYRIKGNQKVRQNKDNNSIIYVQEHNSVTFASKNNVDFNSNPGGDWLCWVESEFYKVIES